MIGTFYVNYLVQNKQLSAGTSCTNLFRFRSLKSVLKGRSEFSWLAKSELKSFRKRYNDENHIDILKHMERGIELMLYRIMIVNMI